MQIIASVTFSFVFTAAVDDASSECALDGWSHDERVCNDGDAEKLDQQLERVVQRVMGILAEKQREVPV